MAQKNSISSSPLQKARFMQGQRKCRVAKQKHDGAMSYTHIRISGVECTLVDTKKGKESLGGLCAGAVYDKGKTIRSSSRLVHNFVALLRY